MKNIFFVYYLSPLNLHLAEGLLANYPLCAAEYIDNVETNLTV